MSSTSLDQNLENSIKFLENLSFPWFLRASDVYSLAKEVVCKPRPEQNDWSLEFDTPIETLTRLIVNSTVPLFLRSYISELLERVDRLLSRGVSQVDEGVDFLLHEGVGAIRALQNALREHWDVYYSDGKALLDARRSPLQLLLEKVLQRATGNCLAVQLVDRDFVIDGLY